MQHLLTLRDDADNFTSNASVFKVNVKLLFRVIFILFLLFWYIVVYHCAQNYKASMLLMETVWSISVARKPKTKGNKACMGERIVAKPSILPEETLETVYLFRMMTSVAIPAIIFRYIRRKAAALDICSPSLTLHKITQLSWKHNENFKQAKKLL